MTPVLLIYSADPVTTGSDHCFHTCFPSVPTFQNLIKRNNFMWRQCSLLARFVDLAEWIIDDSFLVHFCFAKERLKALYNNTKITMVQVEKKVLTSMVCANNELHLTSFSITESTYRNWKERGDLSFIQVKQFLRRKSHVRRNLSQTRLKDNFQCSSAAKNENNYESWCNWKIFLLKFTCRKLQ